MVVVPWFRLIKWGHVHFFYGASVETEEVAVPLVLCLLLIVDALLYKTVSCSYECDCSDTGFEGDHCEVDIPECASNPCQHGATCLEGVKGYTCLCWPGTELHAANQTFLYQHKHTQILGTKLLGPMSPDHSCVCVCVFSQNLDSLYCTCSM